MSLQSKQFYDFANFRLDTSEKVLLRDGEPVPLTPKVFDTLQILTENAGRLLEKDELMGKIWSDRFVEEGNLAFNIKVLRKALGDTAAKPRFIETIPKRGYRFIAEVNQSSETLHTPPSSEKKAPPPSKKYYFPITLVIILLVSTIGIAFIWLGGKKPNQAKALKYSRLTNTGKITNAAVSPDGKSLVYSQKEGIGESLWLRQIDSGSQTQILPPQETEFIGLTVSPDNQFAYYSVFAKNSVILTLMRVPLVGGTPESIPDVAADVSVSFSPDGKKFAYTESQSVLNETHLKIADADGTNQKILLKTKGENRTFPVFRASPVAWSPDGETIACVVRETDENGSFSRILSVDPETGNEKYLSGKNWNFIENIVWRDAENLAFIEFEMNSPVKYIRQVSRKTGEARQLTDDLNGYGWLSSAGGNLYTLQKNNFSSLHVAEFAENIKSLQPKQIFGESSMIENVAWSRDEKIFYNSWMSGKNEIWEINTDGTAPRQLTANSNLIFSFAVSPIDNTLVFSSLQNGKISLAAADSNGQNIRQITEGKIDISPQFTPDGENIIFQSGTSPPKLWSVAVRGNQSPKQVTGYLATHPAISPDGKQIAFHFMDFGSQNPHWKLGLIDSETHKFLNKLEFPMTVTQRDTVWHPTKNFLTLAFRNGENSDILLWSITDGKIQTTENISAGKITSFAWSPDGNRLVYSQAFEKGDVISLGE